ncbi:MAG: beta-ketoacyl-ACP synthase [Pseudomonadota bacterium]
MTKSTYKDHLGRPIIAVTGMGIVTALGRGKQDNWQALSNGQSGIHEITRFPTDGLSTRICGTVDFLDTSGLASELSFALANTATSEALSEAGIEGDFNGPLFLAAPPIEVEWSARFALADEGGLAGKDENVYDGFLKVMRQRPHPQFTQAALFGCVAERLADTYGTRGLPITLSTACASGATAIQLGVDAIRQGRTDRSLTVATDGSVNAEALIRFSLLSALSTQNDPPERASKPFTSDRDGFVIAEGGAALVLESLEAAVGRGAKVLGVISGYGEKADHFHRTRSSPDGAPAIATIQAALDDAGIGPTGIDYINAHGTSTPENDRMEFLSLSTVFGDSLDAIPVSSNKSMIGHTLTAAGAVEAIFSLLTIQSGTLPPTINYDNPDTNIKMDVVPNVKRNHPVSSVLSNSFGFGGQNACLVMAAEPA